ncbi:hypothetical protein Tco_0414515 [Tanacetum coccineum]
MDNPNITMEEYIRLEEEKAQKRGKVFNWETAKYGKIWYDEDVHDLRSVETEFPAIVFNDNLTSNETLFCEPTVSSLNNNEIDFRISFDESDDEDYTVVFDKNSFSYKIISANDLKTDSENDIEKVNVPSFPSPEPKNVAEANVRLLYSVKFRKIGLQERIWRIRFKMRCLIGILLGLYISVRGLRRHMRLGVRHPEKGLEEKRGSYLIWLCSETLGPGNPQGPASRKVIP